MRAESRELLRRGADAVAADGVVPRREDDALEPREDRLLRREGPGGPEGPVRDDRLERLEDLKRGGRVALEEEDLMRKGGDVMVFRRERDGGEETRGETGRRRGWGGAPQSKEQ